MEIDQKSPDSQANQNDALFADGKAALAEKPKRTFGLKAVDAVLYGGLNNFTVGISSIFFTYLTNCGSRFGRPGTFARKFGEVMEKRGDWIEDKFLKIGLNKDFAANARMVSWSFIDGSFVVPAIKIFEDRRERLAKGIDVIAHTLPEDESVYDAEPKHSWTSILGGRALTAGVVVPTAVFMNKIDLHNGALKWASESGPNINKRAFIFPSIKMGEHIDKNYPGIAKKIGREAFEEMTKVTIFEAFYTSLCTVGLFFTSRGIANLLGETHGKSKPPEPAHPLPTAAREEMHLAKLMHAPTAHEPKAEAPDTKLEAGDAHHHARIAHTPESALAAS